MANAAPNASLSREKEVPTAVDELVGRYTNYFSVGHNVSEFVIDFGEMYSERRLRTHSRIVMNPSYAKELLKVLGESVRCYEERFHTILSIGEDTAELRTESI
jgi:hypothetical protein